MLKCGKKGLVWSDIKSPHLTTDLTFMKRYRYTQYIHRLIIFASKGLLSFTRNTFLLCVLAFSVIEGYSQTRRYVKSDGTGDGSSWEQASGDLQAMINASHAGDVVWVATGVYKPTTTTDRTISFSLKDSVAIYGGFTGNERTLSERLAINFIAQANSILSGDIGVPNVDGDNSFQVFNQNRSLSRKTILDGFVITAGNANVLNGFDKGGAVRLTIRDHDIYEPVFRNCFFTGNQAVNYGGVIGFSFELNKPESKHSVLFENCRFDNNSAEKGGAIGGRIWNGICEIQFINCEFTDNSASYGGAMFFDIKYGCNLLQSFNKCVFKNNIASVSGGAIYNDSGVSVYKPVFNACYFYNNVAYDSGGAIATAMEFSVNGIQVINSSFQNNYALNVGGVYWGENTTDQLIIPPLLPQFINSSFQNNFTIAGKGSVIYCTGNFNKPLLSNCILWNNGGAETFGVKNGSRIDVNYSLVEPAVTNFSGDSTVIVTTTSPFESISSVKLKKGSEAIDTANPETSTALVGITDYAGNPRFINGSLDMGASEYQGPLEIFTIRDGEWTNPAVWSVKRLPKKGERVWLKHKVTIPTNFRSTSGIVRYNPESQLIFRDNARLLISN